MKHAGADPRREAYSLAWQQTPPAILAAAAGSIAMAGWFAGVTKAGAGKWGRIIKIIGARSALTTA